MSKRDLILQEALALDDADRAYVIDRLQQSLPGSSLFASQEIAEEWSAEIDRRIEQVDNGQVTLVSEEEVLQEMQAKYRGRNAEEAWCAEIDRRIEAAERGEGTALSKSEFIKRLRSTALGRDSA
jgi:hypothetical protein